MALLDKLGVEELPALIVSADDPHVFCSEQQRVRLDPMLVLHVPDDREYEAAPLDPAPHIIRPEPDSGIV